MSHFYEKLTDGSVLPRHLVPMSSRPDELRPTRMTDVNKWLKEGRRVVPSVTTILNVLNKSGLNNWIVDQHLEQAYSIRNRDETNNFWDIERYVSEVKRLTELELDKAPSAGSDFHKMMDDYSLNAADKTDPLFPLFVSVMDAVIKKCDPDENKSFMCEKNFVSDLGYGGQIDLIYEDWVIDYKTKQTAAKFKPGKMAYDDHRMQLAAYRKAVAPRAHCANVFVCLEDGQIDFHEHTEEELGRGWKLFEHALAIWKLQNL